MRATPLLAAVLVAFAPLLVATAAPAGALRPGCHRSDGFGPSLSKAQHFAYCVLGHRADVVWYRGGTQATAAAPDSGGPSCEWAEYHIAKWCYSKGVPHLVCDQYFIGLTLFGHHCSNTYFDNPDTFKALYHHVVNVFHNHPLQRCTVGALASYTKDKLVAALVVRGASAGTGPLGIAVGMGVGCVFGALTYWFH
jgi:hypothetical protein